MAFDDSLKKNKKCAGKFRFIQKNGWNVVLNFLGYLVVGAEAVVAGAEAVLGRLARGAEAVLERLARGVVDRAFERLQELPVVREALRTVEMVNTGMVIGARVIVAGSTMVAFYSFWRYLKRKCAEWKLRFGWALSMKNIKIMLLFASKLSRSHCYFF